MVRPLGSHPRDRPNWAVLNRGQRLYALRQHNVARRNHGLADLPLDVDVPSPPIDVDILSDDDIDLDFWEDDNDNGANDFTEAVMGPPPAKKGKTNDGASTSGADSSSDAAGSAAPENAVASRGGASAGLAGDTQDTMPVPRPRFFRNENSFFFEQVFRCLTFGFASVCIENSNVANMTTWLARVPWDRPFWYLSRAQYLMLPPGCYVHRVHMYIIARNVRVAFDVNATTSGLATLNQNKFGSYAIGLNKKIIGVDRRYNVADTAPMVPTGFLAAETTRYAGLDNALYGVANTDAAFLTGSGSVPAAVFGTPVALPYYYTPQSQAGTAANGVADVGWQNFQGTFQDYDAGSVVGQKILDLEYKPHIAPLTPPLSTIWTQANATAGATTRTAATTNKNCDVGPSFSNFASMPADGVGGPTVTQTIGRNLVVPANGSGVGDLLEGLYGSTLSNDTNRLSLIEKSQEAMFYGQCNQEQHAQPSVHIGVRAVPALTTITAQIQPTAFTDVQAYYEIHTSMEVRVGYPQYYSRAANRNIGVANTMYPTQVISQNTLPMFNGLYQRGPNDP